jgi:hypothetical protein
MVEALNAEHFYVYVFVGAQQNKLSFETAEALQNMGSKARYIKISGNGPNALDFHIAYYMGQLSLQDPTGFFHIISKDKGFDPLIEHLKARKIFAARRADVTEIPLVKAVNTKSMSSKLDLVIANLAQRETAKPVTLKTLKNTINQVFLKQLSDEEVEALLKELVAKRVITVSGSKVGYPAPEALSN